jgi:hypothetical protein
MKNPNDEFDRDRMRERLKAQLSEAWEELEALVDLAQMQNLLVHALKILAEEEDEEPP